MLMIAVAFAILSNEPKHSLRAFKFMTHLLHRIFVVSMIAIVEFDKLQVPCLTPSNQILSDFTLGYEQN